MGVEIHECGTCQGCSLKASLIRNVAEFDRVLYLPRLVSIEQAIRAAWLTDKNRPERERWATREAHHSLRLLQSARSNWLRTLERPFALAGCCRLTFVSAAEMGAG